MKERTRSNRIEWLASRRELIITPEIHDHELLFAQNAGNIFYNNMMLGMMAWRDGDNPTSFFVEALDDIIAYRYSMAARSMDLSLLPLTTAVYIAILLDRQSEFTLGPCALDRCGDIFLDCHLAKRLLGFAPNADVQMGFDRLRRKKRQALAVCTFQTYFDLIEIDIASSDVARTIAQAEVNYLARHKDAYYSGGRDIEGGGQYNEIIVDYGLAAIMKAKGFACESVHRWKW